MAHTSEATTVWQGDLKSGVGSTSLDSSKTGHFPITWTARTEGVAGMTNPEELLAASHASCFSMEFSSRLTKAGHVPDSIQVTAAVTFQPGEGMTGSHLLVSGIVAGIAEDEFQQIAEGAKQNCPVSKALAGIPITMEASLA